MRIFGLGPMECGLCLGPFLLVLGILVAVKFASKGGSASTPVPPPTSVAPAGWLVDPTGRHQLRYWDGQRWTAFVSDDGMQAQDPV